MPLKHAYGCRLGDPTLSATLKQVVSSQVFLPSLFTPFWLAGCAVIARDADSTAMAFEADLERSCFRRRRVPRVSDEESGNFANSIGCDGKAVFTSSVRRLDGLNPWAGTALFSEAGIKSLYFLADIKRRKEHEMWEHLLSSKVILDYRK